MKLEGVLKLSRIEHRSIQRAIKLHELIISMHVTCVRHKSLQIIIDLRQFKNNT